MRYFLFCMACVVAARIDLEILPALVAPKEKEKEVAPAPPNDAVPVPVLIKQEVPALGRVEEVTVVSIHDGDTFTVSTLPKYYKVRLRDCWAPEMQLKDEQGNFLKGPDKKTIPNPAGVAARLNLQRITIGRIAVVRIVEDRKDLGASTTLGRFLGDVWVGEKNLSEVQVKGGFAVKTEEEWKQKLKEGSTK